jgi:hypothetical protein
LSDIKDILVELGINALPEIQNASIGDIKSFIELYGYPLEVLIDDRTVILHDKGDIEKIKNNISEKDVRVIARKSFNNTIKLNLHIDFGSEDAFIHIAIESGQDKGYVKVHPFSMLSDFKLDKTFVKDKGLKKSLISCYNAFIRSDLLHLHIELIKTEKNIYFSVKNPFNFPHIITKSDIVIICNNEIIGEYINDTFKRYGTEAKICDINDIKIKSLEEKNILIVLVNDNEKITDKYIEGIVKMSKPDRSLYCIYIGVKEKAFKSALTGKNIIFIDSPYAFMRRMFIVM